jgi:hypothetical protein
LKDFVPLHSEKHYLIEIMSFSSRFTDSVGSDSCPRDAGIYDDDRPDRDPNARVNANLLAWRGSGMVNTVPCRRARTIIPTEYTLVLDRLVGEEEAK